MNAMSDSNTQALQTTQAGGDGAPSPAAFRSAPIEQLTGQVQDIQNVMDDLMQKGTHYDDITGDGRNSLLQPGAEKLCFAFKFAPSFETEKTEIPPEDVPNAEEPVQGHREYEVRCKLHHRPTGQFVGEGSGSCSTLESKYRYRKTKEATDIPIPGEFWDSYDKSQDETMADADFSILEDELLRNGVEIPDDGEPSVTKNDDDEWRIAIKVDGENPDIADLYNTVLKMAEKRALVNAVKRSTAASDIFTQDTEDLQHLDGSSVQGTRKQSPSSQNQPPNRSQNSTQKSKPSPGNAQWYRAHIGVIEEKLEEGADPTDLLSAFDKWPSAQPVDNWPQSWGEKAVERVKQLTADREAQAAEEAQAGQDMFEEDNSQEANDEAFEDGAEDDDLPF